MKVKELKIEQPFKVKGENQVVVKLYEDDKGIIGVLVSGVCQIHPEVEVKKLPHNYIYGKENNSSNWSSTK